MKFPTLIIFIDLSDVKSSSFITIASFITRIGNGLDFYQFLAGLYGLTQYIYIDSSNSISHKILFLFTNRLFCIVELDNAHRGFSLFHCHVHPDPLSFGHCVMTLRTSIDIYYCVLVHNRLRPVFYCIVQDTVHCTEVPVHKYL